MFLNLNCRLQHQALSPSRLQLLQNALILSPDNQSSVVPLDGKTAACAELKNVFPVQSLSKEALKPLNRASLLGPFPDAIRSSSIDAKKLHRLFEFLFCPPLKPFSVEPLYFYDDPNQDHLPEVLDSIRKHLSLQGSMGLGEQ